MQMLLEEFLCVIEEELQNLNKAVSEENADMITHVAHKMKGASANMMVDDLKDLCSELQYAEKSDKELVTSLTADIVKSYNKFKELL